MNDLGDIQWIFAKTNNISDLQTLKAKVIEALKTADGKPIEELEKISIEQIKKLFPEFKDVINNNNKNINMSIGEFTVDSQIGSQATNLTFSLSLRSNLNDIFELEKLFKQFSNELNRVNIVKSMEVQNLNYHWRIQNSHSLYQKLKNNSMFLTLEIPDSFTSDDFCYYDQISNDVCYLFLGSYLKFKTSRTHTSDYKPNLKFINSSLKLYKYILEEC